MNFILVACILDVGLMEILNSQILCSAGT